MSQDVGKKIEAFWKKATIVRFYPADPNNPVPAVVLIFPVADNDTSKGYELLLDNYENIETKLIIQKTGNKANLTLTNGESNKEFTLKGLALMPGELGQFTTREKPDSPFAFMIGSLNFEHGMVVISTRQPFSPHVISGYELTK